MKNLRKILHLLMQRPFKGNCAYELQVLCIVFQWRYDGRPWGMSRPISKAKVIGPLCIWYDAIWLIQVRYLVKKWRY